MTKTMIQVSLIPIFTDNYVFAIHSSKTNETAIIDPGAAPPVLEFLTNHNHKLNYIFCTHHHWDHIGGITDLKKQTGCSVIAGHSDKNRIPEYDTTYKDGDSFQFANSTVYVKEVFGHTIGHISYHFPEEKILFIGDTLFALGCGRLFEGSHKQMFSSLQWIKSLPTDTKIYCTHEYTLDNAKFALHVDPNNQKLKDRVQKITSLRDKGLATIPFTLEEDLNTNPFLLADSAAEFKKLRDLKDAF